MPACADEDGKEQGFTLVELMVVIGVIAVILAIAVPNLLTMLPEMRLKQATREVVSDLQKSKLESIKRRKRVVARFTGQAYTLAGGGSYEIFTDDGSGGGIAENNLREPGELLLVQKSMPYNVTLYPAGTTVLGFEPGGLPIDNGSVDLRNGLNYYRITVSWAANIRLRHSTDGNFS